MEATGGFEVTVAAARVGAARLPLAVVNPRQIRDFARATGNSPRPTPRCRGHRPFRRGRPPPEPRPFADAQAQELGELVARRRQVIEMMVAERNRRRRAQRRASKRHRPAIANLCRRNSRDSSSDLDGDHPWHPGLAR